MNIFMVILLLDYKFVKSVFEQWKKKNYNLIVRREIVDKKAIKSDKENGEILESFEEKEMELDRMVAMVEGLNKLDGKIEKLLLSVDLESTTLSDLEGEIVELNRQIELIKDKCDGVIDLESFFSLNDYIVSKSDKLESLDYRIEEINSEIMDLALNLKDVISDGVKLAEYTQLIDKLNSERDEIKNKKTLIEKQLNAVRELTNFTEFQNSLEEKRNNLALLNDRKDLLVNELSVLEALRVKTHATIDLLIAELSDI